MTKGGRLELVNQRQKSTLTKTLFEFFIRGLSEDIDYVNTLSSKEQEQLLERATTRILWDKYEPVDDVHIRVIDFQRRVAGVPRWDRAIYESLADLREQVSILQEQVRELMEAIQGTERTYNATIHELGNSKYELTTPIQVVVEEYQEETIARIPELNLYASADTDTEAINELKQEVVNLYEDLQSSNRRLGALPESWLQTLRRLIVKKNG
jgi:hypothetical protein